MKKLIVFLLIITMIIPVYAQNYEVYADSRRVVNVKTVGDNQFVQINVTGAAGTSGIRYRTKGWWIKAKFGGESFPSSSKFYTDSDLEGKNGSMVVEIPLSIKAGNKTPLYEFLGVPKEYYRKGGVLEFDAGQIIVHNGVETEPIYKDFNGINKGIKDRFGFAWSSSVQSDLRTYYRIKAKVAPEIKLDTIEVTHVTTTGKLLEKETISPDKEGPYIVKSKQFDGYDCVDPESGEVEVMIEKQNEPEIHKVELKYNTGELQAYIDGPDYVEEGESFDLSGEGSTGTFFDIPLDKSKGQKMYWYRDGKSVGVDKEVLQKQKISASDIHPSRNYVIYVLTIVDSTGKTSSAQHEVRIGVEQKEPPKAEVRARLSMRLGETGPAGDGVFVKETKVPGFYFIDEFEDGERGLNITSPGRTVFSKKDWDLFMEEKDSISRYDMKSSYNENPREEGIGLNSMLNMSMYDYSGSTSEDDDGNRYEINPRKTKFYEMDHEEEFKSVRGDDLGNNNAYVNRRERRYFFQETGRYSGYYDAFGKVEVYDEHGNSGEAEASARGNVIILKGIPFTEINVEPYVCFVDEGVYVSHDSFDRHNYIEEQVLKIEKIDEGEPIKVYERSNEEANAYINTDYISKINKDEEEGVSLNFSKSGRYKASISVTNDARVSGNDSKEFIVNPEPRPPVADFDIPQHVFAGEDIEITCKSTDPDNDIEMRIWDYPDNEKPEYKGFLDPTSPGLFNTGGILRFLVTGTFTVKLTVVDSTGLEDSIEKEVQVMPPIPVAVITQDDESLDKENRKIVLHSRKSVSPSADPIQKDKTEWTITPLEGQKTSSIKVDTKNSNQEERQLLFKETGKYEVTLSLHNKYTLNPLNWKDENISIRQTKMIIDVQDDLPPNANVILGNLKSPSFREDGEEVKVDIEAIMSSPDKDIIDYSYWKLWRDDNNDGKFTDNELLNKFENQTKTQLQVKFKEGIKGKYQVELFAKEDFGQPTIPKFINDSDYRTKNVLEHFYVNWIPDIEFTLDEWAYPDDTLDISDVAIKDEMKDTTKVKWTLKRASETDTKKMEDVDIQEYTQNTLGKYGGKIRFKKSGYYTLTSTITDEIGQTFSWSQDIRIYPFPTAIVYDNPEYRFYGAFEAKQNRRYGLNGNSSYIYDYFGDGIHEIDRTKDYWEIIALDGQNVNEAVKIRNGTSSGLANSISDNTKFVVKDRKLDSDILLRETGKYRVRYQVTNAHGKKSEFTERIITVKEDLIPTAEFLVISPTYREKDTGGPATLTSYSINASSPDGDNIALKKIRYRFDSNNDGSFEDETWSSPIIVSGDRADIKVSKVGKYQIELLVQESFGQATLDEFVTTKDRREYTVYKEIEVDNMRPTVDFSVTPSNKVDVVFTVGKTDSINTDLLDEKIDRYLRTKLDSNTLEMIETKISTYSTNTISTDETGASDIFSKWENYPNNDGNWSFEEPRKIRSNVFDGTKYLNMSGFGNVFSNFTLEFDAKCDTNQTKHVLSNSSGSSIDLETGLVKVIMSNNQIRVTTTPTGRPGETLLTYNGNFSNLQKITIVMENDTPTLYINGAKKLTGTKSKYRTVFYSMNIGGYSLDTTFKGELENIHVWNRSLTSTEIYNYRNGIDKNKAYNGLIWRAELSGVELLHGGVERNAMRTNTVSQYILGHETFNTIGSTNNSNYFTGYWDRNAQDSEDISVSTLVGVFNDNDDDNIAMTVRHTQQGGKISFYAFVWNGGGDAASGLYKVANENYSSSWIPQAIYGSNKKLLQKADLPHWVKDTYYKVNIEARGNNIKVFIDGDLIINYTDEDNPLMRGSYSVASHSQRNVRFKELEIQTGTTKRIDEALREPEWTDNSHRFVININDDSNFTGIKVPSDEFYYTGQPQEWVAPFTGIYTIETYGASSGYSYITGHGQYVRGHNKGGYSKGDILLNKGEKLYIYNGGQGKRPVGSGYGGGGWNGGGNALHGTYTNFMNTAGGGGATDIRFGGNNLNNRIMVAGGAGGAGANSGSPGGGLVVPDINQNPRGNGEFNTQGATQTRGGIGANNGTLGKGGDGENYVYGYGSAGGGGGYYGGAGGYSASWNYYGDYDAGRDGRYLAAGATGGTSYISGMDGCIPKVHSSGKVFTNIEMKAGVHEGNGFTRISQDFSRQDGSLLTMLLDENIHYIGIGTSRNRQNSEEFIKKNDGRGIFLVGNSPNLENALDKAADYIIDAVRKAKKEDVKYVLLTENVNYKVIYSDYENDPQLNESYWRYNHEENYFENGLGRISGNNIWMDESINRFDKVGKFLIEHRTKDNPVGTDNRFDKYRKWSEMLNGPTTLYVHRKPIALFTANINRLSSAFRVTFKDDSYDLDHQSKSNKGLMTWEWSWKVDTATTWNTQTFSTKNAGISWINSQFNSKPLTNNYIVRLRVRDIDGENGIGEWSDPQVMLISNIGMPPIARFTVNPSVVPVNQNISIQDKSYDPNGDPIVEWRWVLSKTSGANQGTWNYSYNNSTNPYTDTKISDAVNNVIKSLGATNALGDYKLTLQVRDNTGPWGHSVSTSEIYTQTFRVIPVNKSPEAGFNLQSNQNPAWTFPQTVGNMTMLTRPNNKTFFIEELLKWNEWARDPDGHAMEYQWSLERYQVQNISSMHLDKNPEVKNYSGNLAASSPVKRYDNFKPFNGSFKSQGLGYGTYKITLRVNDLPPIPPFMSTDKETIFVTDTYYIIPEINFIENPSFEHEGEEIVVGDTIKLRTVTSKEVTSVNVELVGNNIPLTPISSNHNSITWEKEYVIPETLPERDSYELVFKAHTNYGGNGVNTRTIFYSVPIDILTLKLINFRITDIVNHKPWWQKEYPSLNLHRDIKANPIYIDEMPVPYKAGYYVTFMIDSKGKPDTVTSKVKVSGNETIKTINLSRYNNNPDMWVGRYYSDEKLPAGTIIHMELEAYKSTRKYNYNTKEPFHGRVLEVTNSALKDGVINRTN